MYLFSVNTVLKAQLISVLALLLMDFGPENLYGNGIRANQVILESPDSVTLVNAQWKNEILGHGLILRQYHFNNQELFNSNQYISIIEIEAGNGREVEIVPSPVLIETSVLAQKNNASAAINGSFFKFNYEHNTIDYNSVDYIRKEGKKLAPNTYTSHNRSMHQKGAIAIYEGELFILYADVLKDWERYIQADEIITTGPPLRIAGMDLPLENSSFYTTRHPRTAVAKMKNGNILFFTVDGRAVSSNGMSLEELQKTLRWMGADYIINLDGGGSTTMYVKGKGVVNHPSDNKLFDNKGERKVANVLIVK
jgi:hypothetical protein